MTSTAGRLDAFDCLNSLSSPIADKDEGGWRSAVLVWLLSGPPLYRAEGASPHLCVYFVVLDGEERRLLLVRHRNAGMTLPAGGHVEPDELLADAVARECGEELGLHVGDTAWFHVLFGELPVMVTWTDVGAPGHEHVDVTYWFVLQGKIDDAVPNDAELAGLVVVDLDAAEDVGGRVDPGWTRFVAKLRAGLAMAGLDPADPG